MLDKGNISLDLAPQMIVVALCEIREAIEAHGQALTDEQGAWDNSALARLADEQHDLRQLLGSQGAALGSVEAKCKATEKQLAEAGDLIIKLGDEVKKLRSELSGVTAQTDACTDAVQGVITNQAETVEIVERLAKQIDK